MVNIDVLEMFWCFNKKIFRLLKSRIQYYYPNRRHHRQRYYGTRFNFQAPDANGVSAISIIYFNLYNIVPMKVHWNCRESSFV